MREMPEFVIGQEITSTVKFRNKTTGALVDPTTVIWKWRTPSGVETTYTYGVDSEVTKTGTGEYVGTITILEYGTHASKWKGTGAAVGADEEWLKGQKSLLDAP